MNTCRKIEPLIYLYRDGELSAEEQSEVSKHAENCPRCREILLRLESMDNALAPLREELPRETVAANPVAQTLQQISAGDGESLPGKAVASVLDALTVYLRPALGLGLAAAALLFITQAFRDGMKISDLEHRLQTHGDLVTTTRINESDPASLAKTGRSLVSKPDAAAVIGDPSSFLGTGFMELFRHNTKLFDELSRRYPRLATITLDDGIDDRERAILESDGKAFLNEFEHLMRKGEQ